MFQRNALAQLQKWAVKDNRKTLILRVQDKLARQRWSTNLVKSLIPI